MAPDVRHPPAGRDAPAATSASPSSSAPSSSAPPSSPARVKRVACVGGASLERGVSPEEVRDHLRVADNVVWVDVQDPGPAELAMLVDEFGFHPLSLEGAGEGQRRPKLDEYKGYLALVTYAAVPADALGAAVGAADAGSGARRVAEVDLFVGRNYVLSLHRGRVAAVRRRPPAGRAAGRCSARAWGSSSTPCSTR